MGFIDEVKDVVGNFLKNFTAQYQAAFTAAIVQDILKQKEIEAKEAAGETIGDPDPRQLLHKVVKPDELRGKIGKGDGKKFKDHFAVIKPDWTIEIYKKEGDEEPIDTLNVWKYDVKKHAADPGAKKRMGGPAWIDDSERSECTGCQAGFTFIKRKHHCRACGEIFCGACTSNSYMLPSMGYTDEQRLCTPCYEKVKADGVESLEYEEPTVESEGSFALKLVHRTRFPHFFSFESEEERNDWQAALEKLSKHSPPPLNRNLQMRHAFKEAYTAAVRGDGRWWWSWRVEGTEEEMLSTLLMYILERDVIPGALSDLPGSMPYSMRRKAAKKMASQMEGTVAEMVSNAWQATAAEVAKSEPTLREKIEPQAIPVGEAQQNVRAQIQEKTEAALNAALEKAAAPVLEKIVDTMLSPVENAHVAVYSVFRQTVDNVIEECRKSSHREREFKTQISKQTRETTYSNRVFKPVYDALYANGEELGKLKAVPALKQLNPRTILNTFMRELHRLAADALYTYSQDEDVLAAVAGDGSDADVEAAMEAGYTRVSVKLLHDSQKVIYESFLEVLRGLILPPIENDVVGSDVVQGAVGPLESSIPDPLKQFVSVNDELNNAIAAGVDKSIQEFLEPSREASAGRVAEAWGQERGNQA